MSELSDGSDRFLLNPRGLLWSEIQADDVVLIANDGSKLAGRHEVESTAMFIHAAVHRLGKPCVLATPGEARATLEATLAIEYSMTSRHSVTLPLKDKNLFVEAGAGRQGP